MGPDCCPPGHWAQVHWLLLALCQDQAKNKHVHAFRSKCERAALDGRWVGLRNPVHLDRGRLCVG